MARLAVPGRPQNCLDIDLQTWSKMSDADRKRIIAERNKNPKAPAPTSSNGSPAPAPTLSVTTPMRDIRDWNEEVDDVPAQRLRECIIFQLDHKKDPWYRSRLTPSFVRRFAKKLDEDTPLDFSLDPLIKYKMVDDTEIREVVRDPKDYYEWQELHDKYLYNSRGKANRNVVDHLVHKDCPKCQGKGGYNTKITPDAFFKAKNRVNFNEKYVYCECIDTNPFPKP